MSKRPTTSPINNLHLTSYEAACRIDIDLQSFDTTLQTRTRNVIHSLAQGVEVKALSFESLKQTTECLLELNKKLSR
ncbi:upf0496 protein at4g34320 [Phtheirospermum japonicum]|uniref:Upf0496 protein at4g34320 n=1 Tax=Phtheirospermum japonicum TaxID=374723 RepID=A0A830BLE8_9LAMI|nr:upf0496 protein at4g34320 [Phtheirospermum japonicum]